MIVIPVIWQLTLLIGKCCWFIYLFCNVLILLIIVAINNITNFTLQNQIPDRMALVAHQSNNILSTKLVIFQEGVFYIMNFTFSLSSCCFSLQRLLLHRMVSPSAHWGLEQRLGSRSWITPPGTLPLSLVSLANSYALSRRSSGLCGR